MNHNLSQVAMSHVDSKDEEVKAILAQIDSNDSKESDIPKKEDKNKGKTWNEKDSEGIEWETNDLETPDSEW